jgi:hypothetical protein
VRIAKIALSVFAFFALLGIFAPTHITGAQDIEEINEGIAGFTTDVPLDQIEEGKVVNLNITFHDLTGGGTEYALCTGSVDCLKENRRSGLWIRDNTLRANEDGDLTVKVCGDGREKVKIGDKCPDDSRDNFFWGGNIYFLSIGIISGGINEPFQVFTPIKGGGFYVSRSYPTVNISPSKDIAINNTLTVSVSQDFMRGGNADRRNNYQIVVQGGEGGAYRKQECLTIKAGNTPVTKSFSGFSIGKYTIRINEQVDERGNNCRGGFTYYQITCDITRDGAKSTCRGVDAQGNATEKARDPKGEEYKAFLEDIRAMNKTSKAVMFPCGEGQAFMTDPSKCAEFQTAIGPIKVTPQGFIADIFRYVLTIAAFGAIIIIIYSGYILMTSAGNKEKIAAARETITSAVVGLLFIIFSIVILEIIGVDILRIPGLAR